MLMAYDCMLIAYNMNLLAEILSSQVRAEIFRLLFDRKESSFHLRELQRKSGLAIGTIQKEIGHLKKLDLILSEKDGNRVNFTANKAHPLYKDICGLVEKTTGVLEKLKTVLSRVPGIECAFVFGSFAKGSEKAHSDIDLIVIGSIGLRSLSSKLKDVGEQAEREINPHVYSVENWKKKVMSKEHFITTVLKEEKKMLIGDLNVIK